MSLTIGLIIILIFLILCVTIVFVCFLGLYKKLLEIGNKIEEVLEKIEGGVEIGIKETKVISQEIVRTSEDLREIKNDVSEVLGKTKNVVRDVGILMNLIKGGTTSAIAYSQAVVVGLVATIKEFRKRSLR